MKSPFYLVSIFLLFGTRPASAHSENFCLYAKVNGTLKPITNLNVPELDYLVVKEPGYVDMPRFTLNGGIASTGTGLTQRVFAVDKGLFVFAKKPVNSDDSDDFADSADSTNSADSVNSANSIVKSTVKSPNSTVNPVHLLLDDHSKISNLHAHLCKWYRCVGFTGFLMSEDHSSRLISCSPVDLYFLSPETVNSSRDSNKGHNSDPPQTSS